MLAQAYSKYCNTDVYQVTTTRPRLPALSHWVAAATVHGCCALLPCVCEVQKDERNGHCAHETLISHTASHSPRYLRGNPRSLR